MGDKTGRQLPYIKLYPVTQIMSTGSNPNHCWLLANVLRITQHAAFEAADVK